MSKPTPLSRTGFRAAGKRMRLFLTTGRHKEAIALVDECARLDTRWRTPIAQSMVDYLSIADIPAEHAESAADCIPIIMRGLVSLGVGVDHLTFSGGLSLLYQAVISDNLPLARVLLELGAGRTDDMINDCLMRIKNDNVQMVRLLLDHGADPNLRTSGSVGPFWEMAQRGDVECMRLMVERGASVDARTEDGDGILHYLATLTSAVRMDLISRSVRELVIWGVDPYETNPQFMAPLDLAGNASARNAFEAAIHEGQSVLQARDINSATPLAPAKRKGTRL